jgi:bacillithiol system protein YtxJ
LSRDAAERFGVVHQSPQLILFHRGNAKWSLSHFQITWKAVRTRLEST